MKKSRKPRVQYPPGVNLRQGFPSKPQNQINQKPSTMKSFKRMLSPDLPPGFESRNITTTQKPQRIPQIIWKCPLKVSISQRWLFAAGDESTERQTQNLRERQVKVLEAVYPHHSDIPSCPSVSLDVEAAQYDDSKTPAVPLIPIDGEDSENAFSDISVQTQAISGAPAISETQVSKKPVPELLSGLGGDLSMALAALTKSEGNRDMIDADLLFRILKQPKMVQSLIEGKTPKPSGKETSTLDTKIAQVLASVPTPISVSLPYPNPNFNSMKPLNLDRSSNPFTSISQPHAFPVFEPIREDTVRNPSSESSSGYGSRTNPSSMMMPRSTGPSCGTSPVNVDSVQVSTVLNPVEMSQPGFTLPMKFNQVQAFAAAKPVQMCKPGFQNLPRNVIPVQVSSGVNPNPQVKDMNYFKNLIREHGTVKPETERDENNTFKPETRRHYAGLGHSIRETQNSEPVGTKKRKKRCKYFLSSRGCQLGADCKYMHDLPNQRSQTGGKRMKL